ncbi:hypothetical protein U0070_024107 [Myodes glareolus]|uniref:Uncharacterized protein n=1 Tax=Myodes glareolus TaxID=447135 RepID=A0AAW0ICF9_MYOGA
MACLRPKLPSHASTAIGQIEPRGLKELVCCSYRSSAHGRVCSSIQPNMNPGPAGVFRRSWDRIRTGRKNVR